jgi:hypothetical protein
VVPQESRPLTPQDMGVRPTEGDSGAANGHSEGKGGVRAIMLYDLLIIVVIFAGGYLLSDDLLTLIDLRIRRPSERGGKP